MKKKYLLLSFCILFNCMILYIIVLNAIQLYNVHSKQSLLDLIYSLFAFVIFIRVELIVFHKNKTE